MKINTPILIQNWLLNTNLSDIHVQVTLKFYSDNTNKSVLTLESQNLLCSITLWDTKMLEFIIVNSNTGDDIYLLDIECNNDTNIILQLNKCIEVFKENM